MRRPATHEAADVLMQLLPHSPNMYLQFDTESTSKTDIRESSTSRVARLKLRGIKTLVYAPTIKNKKVVYALVCETLRWLPVTQRVISNADMPNRLFEKPFLVAVLIYDLLFGSGSIRPHGASERIILKNETVLRDALRRVIVETPGALSPEDLLPAERRRSAVDEHLPRFARVNFVCCSSEMQSDYSRKSLSRMIDSVVQHVIDQAEVELADFCAAPSVRIGKDPDLPDVIKLPPALDLHKLPLIKSGRLVLQGKSSCIPAWVLDPDPHWKVIDACAAPGNKSTHVASMIARRAIHEGIDPLDIGEVIAFELDPARFKVLEGTIGRLGCKNLVKPRRADFLKSDPYSEEFSDVEGIILDPSCSGSGMLGRKTDHLLSWHSTNEAGDVSLGTQTRDRARLTGLARFQISALLHSFKFPACRRVVYSTCSVHEEENEDVVRAVLSELKVSDSGWALSRALPDWPRRGNRSDSHGLFDIGDMCVRVHPDEDKTDGFFVALFERRNPMRAQKELEAQKIVTSTTCSTGNLRCVKSSRPPPRFVSDNRAALMRKLVRKTARKPGANKKKPTST